MLHRLSHSRWTDMSPFWTESFLAMSVSVSRLGSSSCPAPRPASLSSLFIRLMRAAAELPSARQRAPVTWARSWLVSSSALCHPLPPCATLCHPSPLATLCHPLPPMPPLATPCHPLPPRATPCHLSDLVKMHVQSLYLLLLVRLVLAAAHVIISTRSLDWTLTFSSSSCSRSSLLSFTMNSSQLSFMYLNHRHYFHEDQTSQTNVSLAVVTVKFAQIYNEFPAQALHGSKSQTETWLHGSNSENNHNIVTYFSPFKITVIFSESSIFSSSISLAIFVAS